MPKLTSQIAPIKTATESTAAARDVFLLESEQTIQHVLSSALRRQGFSLHAFKQPDAMLDALKHTTPVAILLEILDQHASNKQADPYRVLIVDDDQLLAIDRNNFTVEVWKGGSPDTLFINRAGKTIKPFNSQHTSLGVFPKEDFSSETELYQWHEDGHLALFSDGLPEASNKAGKDFSSQLESAFNKPLTASDNDRLQPVIDKLDEHFDGEIAHDDISIMVIRCDR